MARLRFTKAVLAGRRGGYFRPGAIHEFDDETARGYLDRGVAEIAGERAEPVPEEPDPADNADDALVDMQITNLDAVDDEQPDDEPETPAYSMEYEGMDGVPEDAWRGLEGRIVNTLERAGIAPDVLEAMDDEALDAIDGIAQASIDAIRERFPYNGTGA